MSLLADAGRKMIGERIVAEVQKLIREKASSVFLSQILPSFEKTDGRSDLAVSATLELNVQSVDIDFTAHLMGDERRHVVLPAEKQTIEIRTSVPAVRPADMAESEKLDLSVKKITLSLSLTGMEFQKKMMGLGATVHGITLDAELSGSGTGTWRD